ncbi:uncharacterized protein LOC130743076 isoform X2 [Lotus japonicus]|uniref:uncharacterized protein LOC130743076 isoform X2 n=1 Tax=Lotus japonicus TaxID=34305 RepID=UPI002583E752|nr:uncharacterized protein LOC130743076 isoform X2 [Lotus japonicus]
MSWHHACNVIMWLHYSSYISFPKLCKQASGSAVDDKEELKGGEVGTCFILFSYIYSCKTMGYMQILVQGTKEKEKTQLVCVYSRESAVQCLENKGEAMEGGSSNSTNLGPKTSELEALQKESEEKHFKIQELKRQIELTKQNLEKKKKEVTEEQRASFKALSEKYNSLREEYNAMQAAKSRESK